MADESFGQWQWGGARCYGRWRSKGPGPMWACPSYLCPSFWPAFSWTVACEVHSCAGCVSSAQQMPSLMLAQVTLLVGYVALTSHENQVMLTWGRPGDGILHRWALARESLSTRNLLSIFVREPDKCCMSLHVLCCTHSFP